MKYKKFSGYNIVGGISWVTLLFGIGYFFGNISIVKNHFSLVVVAIILISVTPAVIAFFEKHDKKNGYRSIKFFLLNYLMLL